jgi:hypothetical protein
MVLSGGSNRFALIYAPFATTLCGPLRGPGHLFDLFFTLCNYFSTILVCFGSVVGEPTLFLFLGSPILSSFWIKNGKDPPYNPFPYSIRKKKSFFVFFFFCFLHFGFLYVFYCVTFSSSFL